MQEIVVLKEINKESDTFPSLRSTDTLSQALVICRNILHKFTAPFLELPCPLYTNILGGK